MLLLPPPPVAKSSPVGGPTPVAPPDGGGFAVALAASLRSSNGTRPDTPPSPDGVPAGRGVSPLAATAVVMLPPAGLPTSGVAPAASDSTPLLPQPPLPEPLEPEPPLPVPKWFPPGRTATPARPPAGGLAGGRQNPAGHRPLRPSDAPVPPGQPGGGTPASDSEAVARRPGIAPLSIGGSRTRPDRTPQQPASQPDAVAPNGYDIAGPSAGPQVVTPAGPPKHADPPAGHSAPDGATGPPAAAAVAVTRTPPTVEAAVRLAIPPKSGPPREHQTAARPPAAETPTAPVPADDGRSGDSVPAVLGRRGLGPTRPYQTEPRAGGSEGGTRRVVSVAAAAADEPDAGAAELPRATPPRGPVAPVTDWPARPAGPTGFAGDERPAGPTHRAAAGPPAGPPQPNRPIPPVGGDRPPRPAESGVPQIVTTAGPPQVVAARRPPRNPPAAPVEFATRLAATPAARPSVPPAESPRPDGPPAEGPEGPPATTGPAWVPGPLPSDPAPPRTDPPPEGGVTAFGDAPAARRPAAGSPATPAHDPPATRRPEPALTDSPADSDFPKVSAAAAETAAPEPEAAAPKASRLTASVADAVRESVETGVRPLRARLDPPGLGHVTVEADRAEGRLSVRLTFESPEAARLAAENLPALRESLAARGHERDAVEVRIDVARSDSEREPVAESAAPSDRGEGRSEGRADSRGEARREAWRRGEPRSDGRPENQSPADPEKAGPPSRRTDASVIDLEV